MDNVDYLLYLKKWKIKLLGEIGLIDDFLLTTIFFSSLKNLGFLLELIFIDSQFWEQKNIQHIVFFFFLSYKINYHSQ